ncbi:hypothetical protein GYMLUDRAFT_45162 [Collybiopsis luxurians FD-317 M1]|uniref:Serine-threonine/tyrosine-protein kinase catalytic domain-containing protein n=1 Tax=Collybiopsis luxurians FD-317 M1 TaxID=944289 RepID=A0A0D0CJJ3_9AGAR|nr:hypothetical protein GYMLUDRAFT_45162 [Collybiopsis luxurians FD-317 M1]
MIITSVIQIITEKPPFFGQYLTDSAIIIEVLNGVRPPRPESEWFSEDLWDLLVRCWAHNPWDRPSADIVHAELLSMSLSREMFGAMSIAIPS